MNAPLNPYFQVGLDVRGRLCLLIGGGEEAEEKGGRLLEAGARLKLVSPELTQQLHARVEEGRMLYVQREVKLNDLDDVFLVLNTVRSDPEMTRRIFDAAQERRLLINSFDQPAFSNFGMVALVHPGHLRISVSTSNSSPALARRLRQDLEALFDEEFVEYLDQLARARAHIKAAIPDFATRAALLRALVADFRLEAKLHYPENWREKVREALEYPAEE